MTSLRQAIGLHIEPYFAEVSVRNVGAALGSSDEVRTTFYLPRQKISPCLTRFLAEMASRPAVIGVSCRYLERLAGFRLGGSTAQVVTAGFEHWSFFNPGVLERNGRPGPPRPALSSSDLSFGVRERISADGSVLEPLEIGELSAIADKLTLQKAKRVCLHFLHAPRNPSHQNSAAEFFRERGFEVFVPDESLNAVDEIPRWRMNVLQASLSGTFDDLHQEIRQALPAGWEETPIHFLGKDGWTPHGRPRHLAHCGTAIDDLWASHLEAPFVHFGLERWTAVDPNHRELSWRSPWGLLPIDGARREDLLIQPSHELESLIDSATEPTEGGFEPGPVCFGRGQKLLIFDLFGENARQDRRMAPWISDAGLQRRDDLLRALERHRKDVRLERPRLLSLLRERAHRHMSWLQADQPWRMVGPMASWVDPDGDTSLSTASLVSERLEREILG